MIATTSKMHMCYVLLAGAYPALMRPLPMNIPNDPCALTYRHIDGWTENHQVMPTVRVINESKLGMISSNGRYSFMYRVVT